MGLEEAPATFLHQMDIGGTTKLGRTVRLFLVSSDSSLVSRIASMLTVPEEQIVTESSLADAEVGLSTSDADVVIGDVSIPDAWDSVVFEKFDEWAADRPVIILCPNVRDANKYRDDARSAVDIFPINIANDSRFMCVIHTAMLRFQTRADAEGQEWEALSDLKGVDSTNW